MEGDCMVLRKVVYICLGAGKSMCNLVCMGRRRRHIVNGHTEPIFDQQSWSDDGESAPTSQEEKQSPQSLPP